MTNRRFIVILLVAVWPSFCIAQNESPCRNKPEHRQFDYWLGEWDVFIKDKKVAESSIQQILETCVVLENYTQLDGYTGKSVNFYDSHLRKWRQTWVDVKAMVSEFSGESKDGSLHFEGESHFPDGTKALRRMILYNEGTDRLRHSSEISRDDGKTWEPYYDLLYVRRK